MALFGRDYDRDYGTWNRNRYRGNRGNRGTWNEYDRDYAWGRTGGLESDYDREYGHKSRWETDYGDPFGDRSSGTPMRMMRGEFEGGYDRGYRPGYDRGFQGYDRNYGRYSSNPIGYDPYERNEWRQNEWRGNESRGNEWRERGGRDESPNWGRAGGWHRGQSRGYRSRGGAGYYDQGWF